jgi:hypothetical protein
MGPNSGSFRFVQRDSQSERSLDNGPPNFPGRCHPTGSNHHFSEVMIYQTCTQSEIPNCARASDSRVKQIV